MPVHVNYIAEENRLDLSFHGKLDVNAAPEVDDICRRVRPDLRCCIIDLSEVVCLFDSGVALLQRLHRRLTEIGAIVVILSDHPEIREVASTLGARMTLHSAPVRPGNPRALTPSANPVRSTCRHSKRTPATAGPCSASGIQ